MSGAWDGTERRQEPRYLQQQLLDKFSDVEKKIDKIHAALYGNGEPHKGFVVRVDRLEQFKQSVAWALSVIGVLVFGIIIHGIAAAMTR